VKDLDVLFCGEGVDRVEEGKGAEVGRTLEVDAEKDLRGSGGHFMRSIYRWSSVF